MVLLSAATLSLVTSSAHAVGVLPATAGFSDDASMASCFHAEWDNPGRIQYDGCNGIWGWWDVPMPATVPGTKNFAVFVNAHVGGIFENECYAFVLAADGTTPRWDYQHYDITEEAWITFNPLAVNSGESGEISCTVTLADANNGTQDDHISMVKGF